MTTPLPDLTLNQEMNPQPQPDPAWDPDQHHAPVEPVTDDPSPPNANSTSQERALYLRELSQYSDEALEAFRAMKTSGREFWEDFTTVFRPEAIQNLSIIAVVAWRDLLRDRNVHVSHGRLVNRKTSLIACLTAEEWPQGDGEGTESEKSEDYANRLRDPGQFPNRSGGDNERSGNGAKEKSDKSAPSFRSHGQGGMDQITKVYQSRSKYGGGFDDDLYGALQTYETFSQMHGLSEKEMSSSLPVMLEGDALSFYAFHIDKDAPYAEKTKLLHDEFTSEEQRNRLLRNWQSTSLKLEMTRNPEKSQVEVFKLVYRSLTKTQRQLHADYHADRFLRDQLVICADLPQLQRSLKERAAPNTQEAAQRIAALLSSDPGSAGSLGGYLMEEQASALYGLGRRFEGAARKHIPAGN